MARERARVSGIDSIRRQLSSFVPLFAGSRVMGSVTEFSNILQVSPQVSSSRRSCSHFFAAKSIQLEFLSQDFRQARALREVILIFLVMQTPLSDRQSTTSLQRVVPGIQKKDTLGFAMAYFDNSRRQRSFIRCCTVGEKQNSTP